MKAATSAEHRSVQGQEHQHTASERLCNVPRLPTQQPATSPTPAWMCAHSDTAWTPTPGTPAHSTAQQHSLVSQHALVRFDTINAPRMPAVPELAECVGPHCHNTTSTICCRPAHLIAGPQVAPLLALMHPTRQLFAAGASKP
jgi:hypothetical protein